MDSLCATYDANYNRRNSFSTRHSMNASYAVLSTIFFCVVLQATNMRAEIMFLNNPTITVALGLSMSPEPFANRTTAASLASIIDAPTATSSELHSQSTHVWVSGGNLEIEFDLRAPYNLSTFHFWNYHEEFYDVDDIDLRFFDASRTLIGTISNLSPALGNATGLDSTPIFAENFNLAFPSSVRYINTTLAGTNSQIDFNNIGFSGELSSIPEPNSLALLLLACVATPLRRSRSRLLATVECQRNESST
jgi:hypothetical protein